MSVDVRWISVFADVPAPALDPARQYWEMVTGAAAGTPAGDRGEFIPLVPTTGDRYLWLQRLDSAGTGGWHPDFHVPELARGIEAAVEAGAELLRRSADLAVFRTPAGQPFCAVADSGVVRERPAAAQWPAGRSLADQLCLDVPVERFDVECEFWSALTGWPVVADDAPEFRRLNPPESLPVQFLLQRLGADDVDGTRAHLDMSADDPSAEVARHQALGGTVVHTAEHWTTLVGPAGLRYCVTHRKPRG